MVEKISLGLDRHFAAMFSMYYSSNLELQHIDLNNSTDSDTLEVMWKHQVTLIAHYP